MPQEAAASNRPIPQPRVRLQAPTATVSPPTTYENVHIDALNKNTPLNNDNLLCSRDSERSSRPPKVPNNKAFLQQLDSAAADDVDNANLPISPTRIVITELNNLNLDHFGGSVDKNSANKNFEQSHKLSNMPVPAPRRLPGAAAAATEQQQQGIYTENNEEVQEPMQAASSASSSSSASPVPYKPVVQQQKQQPQPASTGAISKHPPRRPPQLPLPPPPQSAQLPAPASPSLSTASGKSSGKLNNTSSGSSTIATSSGVVVDGVEDAADWQRAARDHGAQRYESSGSLNSSTSSGGGGAGGGANESRYVKGSPGMLLKALGEAIGERVTVRTRGAAHKIDKIQQSSLDKIADSSQRLRNAGKSLQQSSLDRLQNTKRSLKNVRQQLGMKLIGQNPRTNLDTADSASIDELPQAAKGSAASATSGSYDFDRPQTVPASDQMFQSISFASPLRRGNAKYPEELYQVPADVRGRKMSAGSAEAPPSYTELYKPLDADAAGAEFRRNSTVTQSMYSGLGTGCRETMNIPCPTGPAPVLPGAAAKTAEGDYGRIRAPESVASPDASQYTEMSPVRTVATVANRRQYDYEETEIRFKPRPLDCSSTRATFDSADCRTTLGSERTVPSADFSAAESRVPRPGRSDSWTFYDATAAGGSSRGAGDGSDEDDDDDEPIYANEEQRRAVGMHADRLPIAAMQAATAPAVVPVPPVIVEPVYGAVYGGPPPADDSGAGVLQPTTVPRTKRALAAAKRELAAVASSGSQCSQGGSHEILREFDPIRVSTLGGYGQVASKSNELMLLESLLSEETYGTTGCRGEEGRRGAVAAGAGSGGDADGAVADADMQLSDDDDSSNSGDDDADTPSAPATPTATSAAAAATSLSAVPEAPPRDDSLPHIPHQNLSLTARQLPDEDQLVAPYLARFEKDAPLPAAATVKDSPAPATTWFVSADADAETAAVHDYPHKSPIDTAVRNFKIFDPPPPPYSERDEATAGKSPAASASPQQSGKPSAMRSILSNVFKRKTSFNSKSPPTGPDEKLGPAEAESTGKSASKSTGKIARPICPRAPLTTNLAHAHDGQVIRLPNKSGDSGVKEQYRGVGFVRERRFQVYTDKELRSPKENIPLEQIAAVQCVSRQKWVSEAQQLYCFEVTTLVAKSAAELAPCKYRRTARLYAVETESERDIWMQRLLEAMTDVLPPAITCRFYRAGWAYVRLSITGEWSGAWCLLQKRKRRLVFYAVAGGNVEVLDLRKARFVGLKEPAEAETGGLLVEKTGPLLLVDCPPYAVYLVMGTGRETKCWRQLVGEVAHNNGATLKEQQLTKDDVAVLVDKCVNFVYAHGSMSEGIYRQNGCIKATHALLAQFRADAFAVQITRTEYSEHDVANALKRFLRELPERMLSRHAASFTSVAAMPIGAEKLQAYRELLQRLPTVERQTLRKLLGHLHFIASQSERNKMTVENLAIIWGPTLLEKKQLRQSDTMGFSQAEANVIVDLITQYRHLYAMTADELAKEAHMLRVLQTYYARRDATPADWNAEADDGQLLVWIYIDAEEMPTDASSISPSAATSIQVQVRLDQRKTAFDVCKQLCAQHFPGREPTALTLSEHLFDGDLRRPLHHTEFVLDAVLAWADWPEAERKNNTMRVHPARWMLDVGRVLRTMPIVSPSMELRWADRRTAQLRPMLVELSGSELRVAQRGRLGRGQLVQRLAMRHVRVYLGAHRQREAEAAGRWALTFLPNGGDGAAAEGKEGGGGGEKQQYFGTVIAGAKTNDQLIWFASIWAGLYGEGHVLPEAEIILT